MFISSTVISDIAVDISMLFFDIYIYITSIYSIYDEGCYLRIYPTTSKICPNGFSLDDVDFARRY
jgi:hypothetical protein